MRRLAGVIAALALAGPAAAESTAVALDDRQLDQVAAGCLESGTTAGSPTITTQVNVSPIIVNQTAIAINTQKANAGKKLGKVFQSGTAVAFNTANINYRVNF
jgi:hypothetical protein